MTARRILNVHWLDAGTYAGWHTKKEMPRYEFQTVGYEHESSNDEYLHMVSTIGPKKTDRADVLSIPRGCIVKIERLHKPCGRNNKRA